MPVPTHSPLAACRSALSRGFAESCPQTPLDKNGYVSDASLNLIPGVSLADFETDLRQGDGNEMEGKFRAVHSSSALAVNTFARFRSRADSLHLPVGSNFTSLSFERKCPHGLAGRRSPNLDIVVEGPSCVIAIESKCLEPLSVHQAEFAAAYNEGIKDRRRETGWFREMLRLDKEPAAYRWLDAAQLVKHAFGIAHTFTDCPATLLYLFWEPSNAEAHPLFAEHRAEVARFSASIAGGSPDFVAVSYPELWKQWETRKQPEWLQSHIGHLRTRYGVAA